MSDESMHKINGYMTCEPAGRTCNAYSCRCELNSSDTHCLAKLQVKALYARNLCHDVDGSSRDSCDPYTNITAYREDGPPVTKLTRHLNNDVNPDWNKWFNFGRGQWKHIKVSIWDHDRYNAPDPLSYTDFTKSELPRV